MWGDKTLNLSEASLAQINIQRILSSYSFDLGCEKNTQYEIESILIDAKIDHRREYRLDGKSIIDFYFPEHGIGLEIKLKGGAVAILDQCERYCGFDDINILILATAKTMGFPRELNDKPCYYISLGKAWL